MKTLTLLVALLFVGMGHAQAQINTNCTTNGDRTHCTSTDQQAQQQAATRAGANVANLGIAIAQARARHVQAKFCHDNPGQIYKGFQCPTEEEAVKQTAALWRDKHPKFRQCPENGAAMVQYMLDHNLDPTVYKSYDIAFKALKAEGKIIFNK